MSDSNSNVHIIRIGQSLKSNQSITISDHEVQQSVQTSPSFGQQIYLKNNQDKLMNKYLLLCSEVQRLVKLSQKQHTQIYSLTQQIQIKGTDFDGFKIRQDILQQQLKKLQVQDKQLLSNNHRLEQILLEKNRLTALLQEQLQMLRTKVSIPKDNTDNRTIKIKQLQQQLSEQKSRNFDLDRKLKQAIIVAQRAESRINAKLQNDKILLINAQNKILDLQQQLRKYIAEKQILQQNQIRFRQQQITFETLKISQFSKHTEQLQIINFDLINQRKKSTQQIIQLQKRLQQTHFQLRLKVQQQSNYLKQITILQTKIDTMNNILLQKEASISQLNIDKSDLDYKLQTIMNEFKRLEVLKNQLQQQPCKACVQFQCENNVLSNKIKWIQQLMQSKQKQYKINILKTEKQLKNVKQLLQSVNNLKFSNERVSRLLETSSQKIIKVSETNKTFQSTTNMY